MLSVVVVDDGRVSPANAADGAKEGDHPRTRGSIALVQKRNEAWRSAAKVDRSRDRRDRTVSDEKQREAREAREATQREEIRRGNLGSHVT